MPASKAQQKAVSKYVKANYDLYQVKMPKSRKDEIKAPAEVRGESVNGFINRAIDNQISQDRRKGPSEALKSTREAEVALPSEQEKAQEADKNGDTAKED